VQSREFDNISTPELEYSNFNTVQEHSNFNKVQVNSNDLSANLNRTSEQQYQNDQQQVDQQNGHNYEQPMTSATATNTLPVNNTYNQIPNSQVNTQPVDYSQLQQQPILRIAIHKYNVYLGFPN
jgi:hypothetical protein